MPKLAIINLLAGAGGHRAARALAVFAPLLVLACGPVPVQQAERECLERARLAQKPQAEIFFGVNSDGEMLRGGRFGVSTDYLAGRDPNDVFTQCVKSRAGQFPTRAFSEFPPAP